MKDKRGARKTLDELVKTYPKSEAAQAGASERLASLQVATALAHRRRRLPSPRRLRHRIAGMQESDLPAPRRASVLWAAFAPGGGLRRHRAAHALLHHGRGGRHRQHRRLDAHAHVGAGHRRGDDRLQRHGGAGLGRGRATASTPGRALLWLSNAGRRAAVRLRHGAGLGLRQQDAGARRRRQPEVAGGASSCWAWRAYATLRGVVGRGARGHASTRWPSTLPAGQDLPSLLAHATGASRRHAGAAARRRLGGWRCWPGCWRGPKGRSGRRAARPGWASAR